MPFNKNNLPQLKNDINELLKAFIGHYYLGVSGSGTPTDKERNWFCTCHGLGNNFSKVKQAIDALDQFANGAEAPFTRLRRQTLTSSMEDLSVSETSEKKDNLSAHLEMLKNIYKFLVRDRDRFDKLPLPRLINFNHVLKNFDDFLKDVLSPVQAEEDYVDGGLATYSSQEFESNKSNNAQTNYLEWIIEKLKDYKRGSSDDRLNSLKVRNLVGLDYFGYSRPSLNDHKNQFEQLISNFSSIDFTKFISTKLNAFLTFIRNIKIFCLNIKPGQLNLSGNEAEEFNQKVELLNTQVNDLIDKLHEHYKDKGFENYHYGELIDIKSALKKLETDSNSWPQMWQNLKPKGEIKGEKKEEASNKQKKLARTSKSGQRNPASINGTRLLFNQSISASPTTSASSTTLAPPNQQSFYLQPSIFQPVLPQQQQPFQQQPFQQSFQPPMQQPPFQQSVVQQPFLEFSAETNDQNEPETLYSLLTQISTNLFAEVRELTPEENIFKDFIELRDRDIEKLSDDISVAQNNGALTAVQLSKLKTIKTYCEKLNSREARKAITVIDVALSSSPQARGNPGQDGLFGSRLQSQRYHPYQRLNGQQPQANSEQPSFVDLTGELVTEIKREPSSFR